MSDAMTNEGPKRRNFQPGPRQDATRLFERAGPTLTVCVHEDLGFMIGEVKGLEGDLAPVRRALWSHDAAAAPFRGANHPDTFRTAASWPDEASARAELVTVLTRRDWTKVSFVAVVADVAESPDAPGSVMVESSPTSMCSIEACARRARRFAPDGHHRLDPQMRRVTRTRSPSVSLPRLATLDA